MIATAALMTCAMASPALAEKQPAYDKRIEEAAAQMLVPKLGDIRGSLDLEVKQHLFPPLSQRATQRKAATLPAPLLRKSDTGSILSY